MPSRISATPTTRASKERDTIGSMVRVRAVGGRGPGADAGCHSSTRGTGDLAPACGAEVAVPRQAWLAARPAAVTLRGDERLDVHVEVVGMIKGLHDGDIPFEGGDFPVRLWSAGSGHHRPWATL